jgi:drug/metabolite transporter (DMT)-like permease
VRPARRVVAALALALLGTWLAAAPAVGGGTLFGVILGLLTGLWYAAFLVPLDRLTRGVEPIVATACIVSGAAVTWIAAAALGGGFRFPASAALGWTLGGIVLFPTILGFALFVAGMRRTGPQVAAILSTFEPVGTLVLAAILLGERLLLRQWTGAGLVVAAAILLALGPDRRPADRRDPAGHVPAEVSPSVPH